MDIKYGKQIDPIDLEGKKIDLFLFSGNHEMRFQSAYKKFNTSNQVVKAIMFSYPTSPKDLVALDSGVEKKMIHNHNEIYQVLDSEFSKFNSKEINIIVDYSCMTKSWYYSIILYLAKKEIKLNKINTYFIYTPSKYSTPQDPKPNSEIAPLPGKYVVPTNKPKALIVCLGYEQNKAEGIIDHLDPKLSYIFYTKPALDPKFVETLESNNENILKNFKNIITFPFDDLLYLERKLTSVYYLLKDDYNIIIAPIGPKPFTLIAMLLSVKYNDIDIWRVGSGSDINEYPREPFDICKFIINEVVFENS